MRAQQVVRVIEQRGGYFVRQKGSHAIFRVEQGDLSAQTVVPMHGGDVPTGTLRSIQRQLAPVLGADWLIA